MNHSASLLSIGLANVLVLLLAPVETLQRDTFLKAIAGAERENANLLRLQELSGIGIAEIFHIFARPLFILLESAVAN